MAILRNSIPDVGHSSTQAALSSALLSPGAPPPPVAMPVPPPVAAPVEPLPSGSNAPGGSAQATAPASSSRNADEPSPFSSASKPMGLPQEDLLDLKAYVQFPQTDASRVASRSDEPSLGSPNRLVTAPQPMRWQTSGPITTMRASSVAVPFPAAASQVQVVTTLQDPPPLTSRFDDLDVMSRPSRNSSKDVPDFITKTTGPVQGPASSKSTTALLTMPQLVSSTPSRHYSIAYPGEMPLSMTASLANLSKGLPHQPTIIATTSGGSAATPVGTTSGLSVSTPAAVTRMQSPLRETTVTRMTSPLRETRVTRQLSPIRAISPLRAVSPLRASSPVRQVSPRQERRQERMTSSVMTPRPPISSAPSQVMNSPRRGVSVAVAPSMSGRPVSPLVVTRTVSPRRDRSPSPTSRHALYASTSSLGQSLSVGAPAGMSLSSKARAMRMMSTGTDLTSGAGHVITTMALSSSPSGKVPYDTMSKSMGYSEPPAFSIPGISGALSGLSDLPGQGFDQQPPPPRNAPANMEMQMPPRSTPGFLGDFASSMWPNTNGNGLAPEDSTFYSSTVGESFYADGSGQQYGRSLAPLPGEGSDRHILSIMTSDNNWDSIAFANGANLESLAMQWINKRGLNPAFKKGLLSQMRHMVRKQVSTASVDIVDLL